jgi:cytidine deaminase
MSVNRNSPTDALLVIQAEEFLPRAWSPYSGIQVACLVELEDGSIFAGVNVENASLGLSICAERNALAAAVTAGAGVGSRPGPRAVRLVLTSNHPDVTVPCGACRQVIAEIAPRAQIIFGRAGKVEKTWASIADLLPDAFDGRWRPDPGPR